MVNRNTKQEVQKPNILSDLDQNEHREIFSQGDTDHLREKSTNKNINSAANRLFSPLTKAPTNLIVPRAGNKNFIKANIRKATARATPS